MGFPLASLMIGGALLLSAVIWDLRSRRIPNLLVVSFAATGLLSQMWAAGPRGLGSGLAASLLVLALLWLAWARGRVGGGDVKLAAAAATWVGLSSLASYLLAGAVAGGVVSLVCYLASAPRARLQMRANLVTAGLGGGLAPVEAGRVGRRSVPYAVAVAAGLAFALSRGA